MPSTRRFLIKAAGAVSAVAAAGGALLPAQTATPSPPPRTPTPGPPAKPGALAALARERYAKFLTPEELPLLDEDMAGIERRSARLAAIELGNAEEPAVDFTVVRR